MALDLTGIENVEFYSGHYLSAVLEGDLKGLFDAWKKAEDEEGRKAPYKRFNPVATTWEKARRQAAGELDAVERWRAARTFHAELIEALGYPYAPDVARLEDDTLVPLASRVDRDGRPYLWIVDAPFPLDESTDALDAQVLREQYPASVEGPPQKIVPRSTDPARKAQPATWRELLDTTLFRLDDAPRWILFLGGDQVLLAERHKWPAGRFLRFGLGALFARRETKALQAFCALIHRDALAPGAGLCLHDTLEENSHKHAFAVSGDLKHGVRRAVELLANEAVWYRREKQRKGVFNEEELAKGLERDCLTWLYRLLFLFYVEARGKELGVVPMNSDAYRHGYSLEGLRDLELVPLTTEQAREGYYLDHSLKLLFRIVNEGFPAEASPTGALSMDDGLLESMRIPALHSPLFDDEGLQILQGVRFRNHVLQEILQLLSLSAEKKRKTRGRISYAQLGINQLGAVYEGLLSYTGFFATEDLYEVAAEKDCKELSGKPAAEREALKTYFVPASRIGDYKESEIVRDEHGKKVVHAKGSFLFRLAGRNREKSASYYTPEVLTQCLVKYALKELLWEEAEEGAKPTRKKTADEILALTICEPAMGSSAFLIEAVDQLADAYLEARQEERGETIPPDRYQYEKRRVKARLATNNCYGVDLNSTAVELAKVSLWLATLHEDGKCPWFGLRLATGNSLVGARREVFKTADVTRKGTKDAPNWLGLVPEPVPLHHGEDAPSPGEVDWANWTAPPHPKGTIYHFLLPAEGMAAFDADKVIKQLAPESVKRIQSWRKDFCKPFGKKDAERLEQISDAVDRLFAQVVRERVLATQETSDRIPVWGEPPSAQQADLLVRDQEEVAASLEDGSSAYRRLKLAMDAWCALWFWPIDEAELLPDRATWLAQMELILKGQVTHEEVWQQQNLFAALTPRSASKLTEHRSALGGVAPEHLGSAERLKRLQALSDAFLDRRADYVEACGLADVQTALEEEAAFAVAHRVANRLRFHHWPLRFAEVFAARGGFDLVVGNPPWVKIQWNDGAVIADFEPRFELRRLSSSERTKERAAILREPSPERTYSEALVETQGLQAYLGAAANYALLAGVQANLYKCFLSLALGISAKAGITSIIHQKGTYDDPKGAALRRALIARLRWMLHFSNKKKVFPEIKDTKHFDVSIFLGEGGQPNFRLVANLFHPSTLAESLVHDGRGSVPSIKDENGDWVLRGHSSRVIHVSQELLELFSDVYDESEDHWSSARLPILHSQELIRILARLSRYPRKLSELDGSFFATVMFDEDAASRAGTIKRETAFPESVDQFFLQGPHFSVATPILRTPNENCQHHQDYSGVDLLSIGDDYLPRTNYIRSCSPSEFALRLPKWNGRPITQRFRHVNRTMLDPSSERTLVSCLIPPGVAHIDVVFAIAIEDVQELVGFSALASSIPVDFFVKSTGKSHLRGDVASRLPLATPGELRDWLICRAIRMNCLTRRYEDLWEALYCPTFESDSFTKLDPRLSQFSHLSRAWALSSSLRADFERRQALVEIDVLASMMLGLEIAELDAAYRVQFPVLQGTERDTVFDQSGRVIPTASRVAGKEAVSLVRAGELIKEQAGFDVDAEYHPDGSNTQELRKQKIRLGKKEADVLGVSERCTMADLLAETEVRWSDEDHPEGRPVRLVGLRYTDPGLEPRMERVYPTPWTRCDREEDYRVAWAEFERRLGKKMPEGTPL